MTVFIFSLVSLICSLSFLFLAMQTLFLDRKNMINISFAVYCLLAGLLAFFEFMARQALDPVRGALWINLQQAAPFVAAAALNFILEYTKINKNNFRFITHTLLFVPLITYLFFIFFTDYFSVHAVLKPWGFSHGSFVNPGLIKLVPVIWMTGLNIFSIALAFKYYILQKEPSSKSAARYIFIAMLLPFFGATIENTLFLCNRIFPETITLFTLISAVFLYIAIYRHRLFEINPAIAADNIVRILDNFILLSDENDIIKNANPAVCKALGLNEKDLIGKNTGIISMNGILPGFILDNSRNQYKVEPVKNVKTCLKTSGGKPLYVLLSLSPIYDITGVYHGYVIAATDITQRIALENNLFAEIAKAETTNTKLEESNRKLLELDRLKKNFIAIVSHELRTPLTSIKGFLAFLSHGVGGNLSDKQKEFTGAMGLNVDKLLKLINELLDFSKIDSGTFSIDKKTSDIFAIAKKAVIEMSPIAAKREICIRDTFEGAAITGIFDETRISQVIINLLTNAVKYTYSKTSVFVECSEISDPAPLVPDYFDKTGIKNVKYCIFSVRDEGPGMDPKYCRSIFDQFYQIEEPNTRKHQGVGLGLNISLNIIKAHNGFIWAESKGKDTGASMYFVIPLE